MTLNRASRKEADTRLSALRKQVSLQVFTLKYEDAACREARTAAEELAEATSRLSVEIDDCAECGDLVRKFRIDAPPALVAAAKGAPDLRLYGVPTGYALIALLEALTAVGAPLEFKSELVDAIKDPALDGLRATRRLDLVVSRRESATADAAAFLWRVAAADFALGERLRIVCSVRVAEDFPFWACRAGSSPALLVDGVPALSWPFTDLDIVSLPALRASGV